MLNSEGTTNLNQLTTSDDYFAPLGQMTEAQEHSSCVVVHNQSVFGARESADEIAHVLIARASLAGFKIQLKIGVATRHGNHVLDGFGSKKSSSHVGVQDDPRGIDDSAKGVAAGLVGAEDNRLAQLLVPLRKL